MATTKPIKLRVLELYSGIGGMHWALKESGVEYEVVMAVDINTTANRIYQHNFPATQLLSFGLEKLSLSKLKSLGINTILMSPPCQPFTRVGKKGDCDDVRTKSFLHILKLIREMTAKPDFILVENVKGFETSQARELLVECLRDCGYVYQEFLLTPLQFGIPNCRLRYYMIARINREFAFTVQPEVFTNLPEVMISEVKNKGCGVSDGHQNTSRFEQSSLYTSAQHCSNHSEVNQPTTSCDHYHQMQNDVSDKTVPAALNHSDLCQTESHHQNSVTEISSLQEQAVTVSYQNGHVINLQGENERTNNGNVTELLKNAGRNMRYCEEEDEYINEKSRCLSEFMEAGSFDDLQDCWLKDKDLKLFVVMDIVFPALKKSTCFTKRYGHYVDGAGSVVQMTSDVQAVQDASNFKTQVVELKNRSEWGETELSILRKLQLRYFTPREVANLMCFPSEFEFPEGVSSIQKYRVLGNSLNVHVVSKLIRVMTAEI